MLTQEAAVCMSGKKTRIIGQQIWYFCTSILHMSTQNNLLIACNTIDNKL